ncbi:MAG: RsbRD N-terminal domain-containing protein [Thermodesulfobacteriota bacterium]
MQLHEFLAEEKGEILPRWISAVLDTYPTDAARIFKREQDRFANPIGYNTEQALTRLYDLLFVSPTPDLTQVAPALEEFVKIRAVQDFAPSAAVGLIHALKKVVRAACSAKDAPAVSVAQWQELEERLDLVAGMVFDLYMACRERLFQTRVQEIRSRNHHVVASGCPSARLRGQDTHKAELQPIHIHNTK